MKQIAGMVAIIVAMVASPRPVFAAGDIVLWTSDFSRMQGNWSVVASADAAGGQEVASADRGWSALDRALAAPADYAEAKTVSLNGGKQTARLVIEAPGGGNFDWMQFTASTSGSDLGPYTGTPVPVPGRILAANFDNGGEGVAYHDTTPGNAGGQYRNTDVDIQASSEGGYNVGWTAAGEWLNYTADVASAGAYNVQLRVASTRGGTMHVGFNAASNVWSAVDIPNTGDWQTYTTVTVPVSLGAGVQQMTLLFDTGSVNLLYADVATGSGPPPPPGGSEVIVVQWNIEIDSSDAHARTTMDYLAALNPQPQIIVIAEARSSAFNTYIDELQNRTGKTWRGAFHTHCPLGAWNGSSCTSSEDEGVGVFTTLPVLDSSGTILPYADQWHSGRAATRLVVSVNGIPLQVFGIHLQVIPGPRYSSMAYLKSWASNFAAPQLVAGDFNADPDQIDTPSGMSPNFVDSWSVVGSGRGFTAFTPAPTMKLDYWFADASGKATPNWSAVVTSTGVVSDHFPVQASFTIQP
jgi:endonuclease/exonuclease/phosphatase family metal-dependent hydrolase